MSELVLENKNVLNTTKVTADPKIILRNKNDIKFLIDIGIMAMFNVMIMAWNPYVEIPLTIGLIIASQVMRININRFKEKM